MLAEFKNNQTPACQDSSLGNDNRLPQDFKHLIWKRAIFIKGGE